MIISNLERVKMSDIRKNNDYKEPGALLPLINELKEMFSQFFNQNWFFILLDNSDIDSRTLIDIIDMLDQEYKLTEDIVKLTDFTLLLTKLLIEVRDSVLPAIREKLHISGFQKENIEFGDNEYVRRILIAQVFPDNLKRLEEIILQLRSFLNLENPPLENLDPFAEFSNSDDSDK